jgi:anti-anti-sigma factor
MTTPLTLDTNRSEGGMTVLLAEGEIDQSNIDTFKEALTAAAETASSGELINVDLSAVEYLDSAAINVLFANADHIQLVVNPLVKRILHVSGVTEVANVEVRDPTVQT